MCATTGRSGDAGRRRRSITPRQLQGFTGILQADAYSGNNELYDPARAQGPITAALCWAHARRQFFELADIAANARRGKTAAAISPIALEAVKRIDALFDIERGINGHSAEERLRVRREQSAPLLAGLEAWLRKQRSGLSRSSAVAEPIDCMLRRWDRFVRFINDGRICLTNNAAERALRGFALGRKSWLFAGSERGADRAAVMATLIMTAKMNDVDPQAWLADVWPASPSTRPTGSPIFSRGIGAPMSGLSRRLKQLENELLALGEDTMLIEELDGFIAGLLVCPDLIKPSEWLPIIWSPDGDDLQPALKILTMSTRSSGSSWSTTTVSHAR